MINKETVDKIIDTARIEDVVGDFVNLKRRGVNMIGLCPFHNEKTPSFYVSPAKGICKCFGCGKGGNPVQFIMEHEKATYPEALRYLAKKYHIEIEEVEQSREEIENQNERESAMIVLAYAQKYFSETLDTSEEGISIGKTYFTERGFTDATIKKFQLGYSPESRNAFTEAALKAGYKKEYLAKTGLCSQKEDRTYDFFSGRVIFPIHNNSGRIVGFAGRILRSDIKTAKYLNTPETDYYHKKNLLYGLYFAKKEIIAKDNCYLVEGYTDVISLSTNGVENVVASSGTSLTIEQIQLIKRYTPNITILYDGDSAGVKASFRAIDLILEAGMNVKIVLFPDGEDPDSFARKVSVSELEKFLATNARDFISFKTGLLLEETGKDPIKRAGLIREIVSSIALVPDSITRSVYIRECSRQMEMSEQILLNELNKIRRTAHNKEQGRTEEEAQDIPFPLINLPQEVAKDDTCEHQERDIIRILIQFGSHELSFFEKDEFGGDVELKVTVAALIVNDLDNDGITFENSLYGKIYGEFKEGIAALDIPGENYFLNHSDQEFSRLATTLHFSPHSLSENWEKLHHILTNTEEMMLKDSVLKSIYALKTVKLMMMISENQKLLREEKDDEAIFALLEAQKNLQDAKMLISKQLGRIILK